MIILFMLVSVNPTSARFCTSRIVQYSKYYMEQQDPPITAVDSAETSGSDESRSLRGIMSTVGILLLAPIIAVLLTLFVFQSYQVDGPSMEPTLQDTDRLIVWKLGRTWSKITGHQYVPNRGDIIILNEAGLASFGSNIDEKQLVKRVIGLPGDHVVIKDNIVTVYNKEHPQGFQPDTTLPYGKDSAIPPTTDNIDITLSDTELFVCGDNRTQSLDSRRFGPIQTSQVVGKLVARILPLNTIEKF